ncbi:unnamed protein product [Alopecurus aequalis]
MDGRRWSDLPADVLREISARVSASADFVCFHAVCKPWRNSRDPPLSRRTTATQFLPWLLAPAQKESSASLKFWCVFSKACYHATPASPLPGRNWVCSVDGTTFWYLTVENLRPSLHNPLTREATHLPPFPHHIGKLRDPHGVVYGDGSTFLYKIFCGFDKTWMTAALLNPRDAEWTVVERTFQAVRFDEFYAAYHGGKIMVTVEASLWHVITLDGHTHDVLVQKPSECTPWWQYLRQYNYLLESRGELLWALVQVETSACHGPSWTGGRGFHKLSLFVHALEEEEDDSSTKKTMRWVRKDGHSLVDRVLFLGWPNSFAVDASRLGGQDGACAYMAYSGIEDLPRDQVGVFRFNLISNEVELIDPLPREWNEGRCTWIIPQPAITPIQELTERRLVAGGLKQQRQQHTTASTSPTCINHIGRYYGPCFRALVRNLPPTFTSSQLQIFLSKHGKVSSVDVIYYRKKKHSQAVGFLAMSTIHANAEDAVEALNALSLHGYRLDVSLVNWEHSSAIHNFEKFLT